MVAFCYKFSFKTQCWFISLNLFFSPVFVKKKTHTQVLKMSKLFTDSAWQRSYKVKPRLWKMKLRGGWRAVSAHKDMGQVAVAFGPETLHCGLTKHIHMMTQTRTHSMCFVIFHFTAASEERTLNKCFVGDVSLLYAKPESWFKILHFSETIFRATCFAFSFFNITGFLLNV